MFAMFAMTTDSVGIIIPEVIRTFQLSLTAAGTFQYATMTGIALAGLLLGSLADRFGRRRTIVIGLTLFAAACFLLAAGNTFSFFAVLLGVSGLAIGIFKTGALALIGDISTSTAAAHVDHEHRRRVLRSRRDRRAGDPHAHAGRRHVVDSGCT